MSILSGGGGGGEGGVRSRDRDPRATITDASSVHCDLVYHGVVLVAAAAVAVAIVLLLLSIRNNRGGKRLRHDDVISRDHAPYGATPITPNHRMRSKDRGLDWGGKAVALIPGNVVD